MKKLLVSAVVVVSMVAGSMALASPAIQKKHPGKDCAYCHVTAKVEKKKGLDCKKLQQGPNCATCHAKLPKDCPK